MQCEKLAGDDPFPSAVCADSGFSSMAVGQPAMEEPWIRRHLRAPREDFGVLCEPPLAQALDAARQNHAALAELGVNLQGRTVGRIRAWTRDEALRSAREYTAELLGDAAAALPEAGSDLLFVGGHQPALFHPGVWIKNFAIHELARRSSGTALNLSVDTDILGSTRIRVPSGSRANPRIEFAPFDADRPRGPWEENAILDRGLFESFGERVAGLLAAWGYRPLIREFWPAAVSASRQSSLLRDCLVAARCVIERRWKAGTLELPISRLCELDPFLWFAGHLLAHLPRFCEVHNRVLQEFREVHHVRSRTRPVPELKTAGDWFEAPFWIWRKGENVRGRLMARQAGREVVLSDGKEEFVRLKLSPEREACCAVDSLRQLPSLGIRLRARALTTTLFSRLCLADLFVHGIGGARYDEMTDRILARFYQVPVPGFLTMTATLHAPLAELFAVGPRDEERALRLLRDLRWNADRHLSPAADSSTAALIAEKRRLVGELGATRPRESNYAAFKQMQEVNRRLAESASAERRAAAAELERVRSEMAANALLRDREYAFCLYPGEKLRRLMTSIRA